MSFFDFEDSYSANKESSFFTDDVNDNRAGEKRSVNCFDEDKGEDARRCAKLTIFSVL